MLDKLSQTNGRPVGSAIFFLDSVRLSAGGQPWPLHVHGMQPVPNPKALLAASATGRPSGSRRKLRADLPRTDDNGNQTSFGRLRRRNLWYSEHSSTARPQFHADESRPNQTRGPQLKIQDASEPADGASQINSVVF